MSICFYNQNLQLGSENQLVYPEPLREQVDFLHTPAYPAYRQAGVQAGFRDGVNEENLVAHLVIDADTHFINFTI